jgi:hypothetical protein
MKVLKLNIVNSHNTCAILQSVEGVTLLAASALLMSACDSKERNAVAASSTGVPVDAVRVRQENVPLVGNWVGISLLPGS